MDKTTQGAETGNPPDASGSERDEQDQDVSRARQELNNETVVLMPDSNSSQIKWCSFKVFSTICGLLFMTLNYYMDMKTLIDYFIQGKIVLFYSYLLFTVLPTICIHLFIAIRLEPNCCQSLFAFLFSPWLLSFKYIQVYGQNTPIEDGIKRTMTVVEVVGCLFKAVPQLYIHSAAWWTGVYVISPIFFERTTEIFIRILVKTPPVAFTLLAEFSEDMPFCRKLKNCIPVAPVLGARVLVCTSLFALQDSWRWVSFLLPFLGVVASWLISARTGQRRVIEAFAKTLLLPPADMAGIVPSALYVIVCGMAVCAGKNCTIFLFSFVSLSHIVGGILWKGVLNKKYKCN
ncbi:uncharacterized protein LOC125044428 [Penaeus chinensis]|uniref:uncharacterized protein LOC125044428 n=1 Tax=Penaeus chinensis TaxID=139456 RepID=UPI001FB5C41A|nr:uncharacterized protein LOC125044428 [Penaeus chinensis]